MIFLGINSTPQFFPSSDSHLHPSFFFFISHKKPEGCHFPQMPNQHNCMGQLISFIDPAIPNALLVWDLGIFGSISKNLAAAFPPFLPTRAAHGEHSYQLHFSCLQLTMEPQDKKKSRKGFSSAHGMTGCSSLPTTTSFVFHPHSRGNSAPGTKQFQQKLQEPSNPVVGLFQPFRARINHGGGAAGCAPQEFGGEFPAEKAGRCSRNFGKYLGSNLARRVFGGVMSFTQNNQQIFQFQRVP